MSSRRLLWKLYPTYLLVILLCIGAVIAFAVRSVKQFHLDHLADVLEARARISGRDVLPLYRADDLDELQKRVSDLSSRSDTRITIMRLNGVVVADSHEDPAHMDNHAQRPEMKDALAGEVGQIIRYSNTVQMDMMNVAVPLRDGERQVGVVRTGLPLGDIQAALRSLYWQIVLIGLAVAALTGLMALAFARWLSRPIEHMTAGAERFARGELAHRIDVPGRSREIDDLAGALNEMAAQLDARISTIARQKSEQEAVLASMVEGVLAVDNDQQVISINEAAAALFEHDAASARGRDLRELVRNLQLEELVGKVADTGQTSEAEITLRGESDRILQAHATTLRDARDKQIGVVMVFNDITRLRRLENIRRDFVANVSHELKTPITSIKGFVETLRDGNVDDPKRAGRFLDIIAQQADRLNAIIEDLLALSRVEQEADRGGIRLSPGRVRSTIDAAADVVQLAAGRKNITIDVQCDDDLTALMNQPLLEQAITNLLDNAIKYSEPDGKVLVRARRDGDAVLVDVRDWGSGISGEHLPRLFERFYRVDKARSRAQGGTGLGLAIVKHIAQSHRGTVTVASTPGEGSTFTIHLLGPDARIESEPDPT